MSPSSSPGANPKNAFFFSSCSIKAFKNALLKDGVPTDRAKCLTSSTSEFLPEEVEAKKTYPGLDLTPDDQCKISFSSKASFCQVCIHLLIVFIHEKLNNLFEN